MKQNHQIHVFCKRTDRSAMAFYAELPRECVFLFQTKYFDNAIFQQYKNSVCLSRIISSDYQKGTKHNPVAGLRKQKIKERIIRMLKWYEAAYDVPIFLKSSQRSRKAA